LVAGGTKARVVDGPTGKDRFPPVDHGEPIRFAAGGGNQSPFATVGEKQIRFWSSMNGAPFRKPIALTAPPVALAWLQRGPLVLTEKELFAWDFQADARIAGCPVPEGARAVHLTQTHAIVQGPGDAVYRISYQAFSGQVGAPARPARLEP